MERNKPKDCWKQIGVQGDGSCPELERYVHCRNCPVYSEAALALLDRPLPEDHLKEWTAHFAEAVSRPGLPQHIAVEDSKAGGNGSATEETLFLFRVAREWLALPPALFLEVLDMRPIHSLPHRRNGAVLGLVNVRGGLVIGISLATLLTLEPAVEGKKNSKPRLLVISHGDHRFAFPADEVHGTHRFDPRTLKEVPATVSKATYTRKILGWEGKSVACLDPALLIAAFNRSLA